MLLNIKSSAIIVIFCAFAALSYTPSQLWGFYAHKLINRMAVFTLPAKLGGLFKTNLNQVLDYSVAPDMRRYAAKFEAARHYIDIDHWGQYPFENVPREHKDAVWEFADILLTSSATGDTLDLKSFLYEDRQKEIQDSIMIYYYQDLRFSDDSETKDLREKVTELINRKRDLSQEHYDNFYFKDNLEDYGVLPYHLIEGQNKLKLAFASMNADRIIRLAGEMGHYLSDAHVPLHTTENYNGQFTNQEGIHAFWESRLPELFAEEEYDFWVGKAEYIEDKEGFFWDVVLNSHSLVHNVLEVEKELSRTFPQDQQYCFDERLNRVLRIECREYAKAYQQSLNGMVEDQMRQAIHAVGSSWYTAWVDAGSPALEMKDVKFQVDTTIENSMKFSDGKGKRVLRHEK